MKNELNLNELEMVNGGTFEGRSEYYGSNGEAVQQGLEKIQSLSNQDYLHRRFEVLHDGNGYYFNYYKNEGYDKNGNVVYY